MSISQDAADTLVELIDAANATYGPFTSAHEALGVCSEEWDELRQAIHDNARERIRSEALDLAAALIRLHDGLDAVGSDMARRSGC